MRWKVAAGVGGAAVVLLAVGVYAGSKVGELRERYGDDDRILIQEYHAVAWTGLGLLVAGWAVQLLRGGRLPSEEFWRLRAADWSGWMLGVGFAFLLAVGGAGGYDVGRAAADAQNATVHGTLVVEHCAALEHGFECEGTFRADDGAFEVARLSGYSDTEASTLEGFVSGPRPLALHDGRDSGLVPVVVLTVFWVAAAVPLSIVAVRKLLTRPAA
ncbi:hypothetical protein ABZS66_04230 [Dactylosporangium sp. NPDC005572]|uniref:hypothetical protein n=1 Tax=Dactylosporangium sp. NPDC005572 TaxID=3156889 RepID=UPI0033A38159